ncbi:MAG: glutathione peroxidase [Planctomycetales bacterium]
MGVVIAAEKAAPAALNFKMKRLNGEEVDLSQYKGKVVLIVNVASKCGLTKQYKELEALHEKYGKEGLAILGFPANEFGKQEPGTNQEIATFCKDNYGVKFDMFEKVVVKGEGQCPLYEYLTTHKVNYITPDGEKHHHSGAISWNFEKFIIGRDGEVVVRVAPRVAPDDPKVIAVIEKQLAAKSVAVK